MPFLQNLFPCQLCLTKIRFISFYCSYRKCSKQRVLEGDAFLGMRGDVEDEDRLHRSLGKGFNEKDKEECDEMKLQLDKKIIEIFEKMVSEDCQDLMKAPIIVGCLPMPHEDEVIDAIIAGEGSP